MTQLYKYYPYPYPEMDLYDNEYMNWIDKPKTPENNNPIEQFLLGLWYRCCPETNINDKAKTLIDNKHAFYWIKKAYKQNLPEAQIELGAMYLYGRGVEINDTKAIKLYVKALYYLYTQKYITNKRKYVIKEIISNVLFSLIDIYRLDCNTNFKSMYKIGVCLHMLGDHDNASRYYRDADIMKRALAPCA